MAAAAHEDWDPLPFDQQVQMQLQGEEIHGHVKGSERYREEADY